MELVRILTMQLKLQENVTMYIGYEALSERTLGQMDVLTPFFLLHINFTIQLFWGRKLLNKSHNLPALQQEL